MRRRFAGYWLFVFGLLLTPMAVTVISAAQEPQGAREIAAALYEDGLFLDAARQWEAVASAEPNAIDARINAAQAYLQADNLGWAMLWFRRAQALDPRHSAVQLGLALVRALRVDILDDEPGLLPAIERLSAEVVSRSELAWLAALAWSAAIGIGTAAYVQRRWKLAAVAAITVAAALLGLLLGREISISAAPPAIVTAFGTALSSEPGPEGVALSRIYAGAEARIAALRDGWMLITLADGRAGWLRDADVQPLAE
jgi:tetratricopeptide (TPR) repeat protein